MVDRVEITIPASYDELRILELLEEGYYKLAELSRLTGFPKARVLRAVARIREKWRLGVDIDLNRIGLKRLIVVLSKPPKTVIEPEYLAVLSKSIDGFYVLSYYIPYGNYEGIVEGYEDVLVDYYLFDYWFKPKPRLLKYYDKNTLRIPLVSEVERVLRECGENSGGEAPGIEVPVLKRFSVLDLKIIELLSKNAFLTAKRIAEILGQPVQKIGNHLRMLREYGVFKGFYIRRYPLASLGKTSLGAVYVAKTSLGQGLCIARRLSEIPLIGTSLVSRTGLLLIQFPIREKMLSLLPVLSTLIKSTLDVRRLLLLSPLRAVRKTPEPASYSKYEKQWLFNIK